jgi:5'-nucleotidase
MKKDKPRIAIDMDGVLADEETQLISRYVKDFGIEMTPGELWKKAEGGATPEKEALYRFINSPGFFRSLPVMEGAVEVVQHLQVNFDIYIVSAAMEFPHSFPEKYDWLQEFFPFIPWTNIVFCGDKSIIDTDYLIDDRCKNLDFCKGKAILFNAVHNTNIDRHQRVNSWAEVKKLFDGL